MIIASPNAQPVSSSPKADAGGGANRTGSPDAVDASSATATEPGQGFGRILAQRMDSGSTSDVAKTDDKNAPAADGKLLFGPDGQPLATTNGLPAVDPEADVVTDPTIDAADPTAVTTATRATAGRDESATVAPKKDGDDAAGNDLAAQLALVSQWAGLPPPSAGKTGGDAKGDGLDIKGKLDTVRVTSSKTDRAAAVAPLASDEAPAAVVPFVASTAQQTLERTLRGASTTSASVTKAADVKAKDDAQAAVAGDRVSLAETILAKVDTAAVHGQNDATSMASAFVTQVTAQASNAQAAAAASATPTPSQLHEPVGTTAWTHEVGQATLRMAANDLQGASLRLNPEHLGPLDVQVRIDNGVAHLAFSAAHAETRQAIESSRTTLDQLFADQGLKIGDCAVGDSSAQKRFDADATQGGSQRDAHRWGSANGGANDTTTSTVTTTVRRALGLVDTFA